MSEQHFWQARGTAARAAVVIASDNDRETAHDMTRGLFNGFLMALVQYDGWEATLDHVYQFAKASRVPAEVCSPKLSVIEGGKNDSVSVV